MNQALHLTSAALGKLQRLDAREIWKHEAKNFTPWLLQHADLLAEALGIEIELTATEVSVGDFNVDLVGRIIGSDHTIIVENQLEPTDHGHLGQLLTYAAGLEAAYIVWVTPQFRDEHRRALDWLNEVTREGISFFGVELELLRILDAAGSMSSPAPHFKLVAQPNDWQKQTRNLSTIGAVGVPSHRQQAYQQFFTDVLARLKQAKSGFTNAQRVGYDSWFNFPSGRAGVVYSANFTAQGRFRTEVYIGTSDKNYNKQLFDMLYQDRNVIEAVAGEPLSWERLNERNASRIAWYRDGRITESPTKLEELKEFAVARVLKLREVFTSRLQQAPTTASGFVPLDGGPALDTLESTERRESYKEGVL